MDTMTLTCPEPWEWTQERWSRERWRDDEYTHPKREKIYVIHAKAEIAGQDYEFLLQKKAFEAIPSSILDQYEGQFVVTRNGQILDHDFDLPTLTNRFFSNYPDADVYISNVGNDTPEVFSTPLGLQMSGTISYVSSPLYGATPAAACDVKFSKNEKNITAQSMIDTGASATGIPYSLITLFNLRPVGRGLVGGPDSPHLERREIYVLTIEFQGFFFPNHPVYRIANEYPLIGRDILNRYFIQLNGPLLNFRMYEAQQ